MKNPLAIILLLLFVPVSVGAATFSERLSGRILLDVEQNGEAWYVHPVDLRRYELGRPVDALQAMRELGLGISNADLARFDRDPALRSRLAGRILLQVESLGEGWYVDPVTLTRHSLGGPSTAFQLMRSKGLGISSADLSRIQVASSQSELESFISGVPFSPQAPFAEWNDPRQQDGCEEAVVLMAIKWVRGEALSKQEARDEIISMSEWQQDRWGYFHDTSAKDTFDRLVKQYFNHNNAELRYNISTQDIRDELKNGHLAIVHINGRTIGHTFYTPPGPVRHTLLVRGYDPGTGEFIVHDPGTRHGENLRINERDMAASLGDYASGMHPPLGDRSSSMIVVRR